MATRRQLEANRANAKRSTGPRSADGKAQSSKNSLAHGLTAQDIVIADEDPEEFERLRAGLQADFEPTSTIELELVERLAGLLWRLRRIPVLEGALLDARREETSTRAEDFTLPVTVRQMGILMDAWYHLQDPEYQEFLTRFGQGPYASPKSEGTSEEIDEEAIIGQVDESGSKRSASHAEESDELGKPKSSHDSVDDASIEAPKDPERYHSRRLRLRIGDPDGQSRRSIRTGLALIKDAEKHDVLGKLAPAASEDDLTNVPGDEVYSGTEVA
jgi:hypothetical protein